MVAEKQRASAPAKSGVKPTRVGEEEMEGLEVICRRS